MIFNSVTFLVFLALVTALYWALPKRPRIWLLFLSSLTFYAFWRIEFLALMLISTLIDYVAARRIVEAPHQKKLWVVASLTVNLSLLFLFKYLMFATENAVGLLQFIGFDVAPPEMSIILPLGISFYTFQTISYTLDVYRGFVKPEKNFALYGCYVTFFPQLVAGPILRAKEVMPQIRERPRFALHDFTSGIQRVLCGLFLKVVLADNLSPMVDDGFAQPVATLSALDVWALAFLFGFQIYFDFAGYSHVAIGCARMMGIRFPENFNFPYIATSPRDFWKRWHISLGSWIRDYLYLPLTGEKVRDVSTGGLAVAMQDAPAPKRNRNRALFESWAIMGLWHGASWTFVLWGIYHATLVFGHRKLSHVGSGWPATVRGLVGFCVTFPLGMLGWIPFRAQTLGDSLHMFGTVLDPRAYFSLGLRENYYLVAALLVIGVTGASLIDTHVMPRLRVRPTLGFATETAVLAVMIVLVFVFLRPIQQFIYFQF